VLTTGTLLSRVTVVLVAGIFALFLSEYSVRLAVPKYDPAGHISFYADPVTGVLLGEPNSRTRQIKNSGDYDVEVVFNRHGLRDRRDISDGAARDLYVLGDSFAFGWGVEENERFSNVLEKLTARRVYNVATTANLDGFERLLAYAAKQGAVIRDVVLAINMIDDVRDYDAAPKPTAKRTKPVAAGFTVQTAKEFLLKNSALYFLATSSIGSVDLLRQAFIRLGLVKTLNVVAGGVPNDRAVRSTADHIVALSKVYGLTVLIIPSRGLWVGEKRKATAAAHRKFSDELIRQGLHVVDMRPVMEAAGDPMQFHFRNDGHWVPKGHVLAAQELARNLARRQRQPATK
jgi:hypothetical protein